MKNKMAAWHESSRPSILANKIRRESKAMELKFVSGKKHDTIFKLQHNPTEMHHFSIVYSSGFLTFFAPHPLANVTNSYFLPSLFTNIMPLYY